MRQLDWTEVPKALPGRERKLLRRPSFWEDVSWDTSQFLLWKAHSTSRGYIVEDINDELCVWVLVFARKNRTRHAKMCDFCNHVHSGKDPGAELFSVQVSNAKWLGRSACVDLECRSRCLEIGVHSMRETLSSEQKIQRVNDNIIDFIISLHR